EKDLGKAAAGFTGFDHRQEEAVERFWEFPRGFGKRGSAGDVISHLANDNRKDRIFRLLLERVEGGDERKAGFQHGGELLRENRQVRELDAVIFRLFLIGSSFGQRLGFAETQFPGSDLGSRGLS